VVSRPDVFFVDDRLCLGVKDSPKNHYGTTQRKTVSPTLIRGGSTN